MTAVTGLSGLTVAPAHADEVDDLIQEMDAVSHKATAKMEEIKGLEDQIARTEHKIEEADRRVAASKAELEVLKGESEGKRKNVGDIAQTRYRISKSDALFATLESGNPQEAIDRSAYIGSLSRNAQKALTELDDANAQAAEKANVANIAVVEARYTKNTLEAQRSKLERERAALDRQVEEIERRVDGLNEVQRQRWVMKDNPLDVNSVLLPPATGVAAAALAQLGKPYGWGSAGPDAFDCSGLMVWAYAQNGIAIPRTSQAQLAGGTPVPMDQLEPGDIIGYYPGVTHVGMYIGDGMVVHSSDYGIPIQVVPVNSMPVQGAVRY